MTDKTLFLHIGSFKTGSTAIQDYLRSNTDALADAGLNYVQAGRSNISHNGMVRAFRKFRGARICRHIVREMEQSPATAHVVSSEMFFHANVARHLGKNLPEDLKARTKVVVYVRRQDKYLEAMYKQLVKNNRIVPNAMAFHDARIKSLAYSHTLAAYADEFGAQNMIVRPFERGNFPNGDVVADFLSHLNLASPDTPKHVQKSTNQTLSAPVSEMLGMLGRDAGVNTRALIRVLITQNSQGAVRSNDVYDLGTRKAIVKRHAADNRLIQQTYCPDLASLFDTKDLGVKEDPYPDASQQVENWSNAAQAIAKGLGSLRASA